MKKFTLFKSVLALIAAFVLVLPTSAQVTSMADLFGTYKFTATVNVTDAGKDLADNFKSECDVTITKCSYGVFDGEIQGLAGATAAQSINGIDLSANTIKITNPNGNGLWSGGLYMSNTEGVYPFGGSYNDILYTFDPATKTITLPEFTLVTCNHSAQTATIVATFTNAKLTLVASENIEVADLSGDWHFTAGKGNYDVMEGSTLPTEFDMTLTATDDSKKNYNISMKLGEFAPLALTATFDGVTLTIPFNETYFDAENKIGIVNMYGEARPGTITFNMINESLLSLSSGMVIAQDSISPEVKGGYMQWYMSGSAKKQGGEVAAATWEGTYTVKAGSIYKQLNDFTYPETFEMEVAYDADYGIYLITKFFGQDVTALNYGGITLTPSADDPNMAEIKTGGYLQTIKGGEHYLCLKDQNLSDGSLVITRLADGTYTISDFCVSSMTYNEDWSQKHDFAAWYQNVTATKAAAEEPVKPFNWANTYAVKAESIDVYNNAYTYPKEFDMEIIYDEAYNEYLVTKFFGQDVTGLNYGGITLTPSADDPNKAELKTGTYLQTIEPGKTYLKLYDMNATTSPVILTANEDGSISISSFCVSVEDFGTGETKAAALYNGATATVGTTPAPIETTDVMLFYPEGAESANEIELQDGFKMAITGNTGKNISSASKITIDGEQYVSIKLSNGAQNTLTLPEGKVATAITFYSYVNKDAQTDRPAFWKEVGGKTYDIETSGGELMCFKDAENPDVRSYTLESPMSSITFTNSGEQLCFVMKVAVADGTSGIEDVTVKPVINVNAPAFNLSGQRVSKTFKGIVIMNGKKYLVK